VPELYYKSSNDSVNQLTSLIKKNNSHLMKPFIEKLNQIKSNLKNALSIPKGNYAVAVIYY